MAYDGASPLQTIEGWIKAGGGTKSDGSHYDWNGAGGITSSSVGGDTLYKSLGLRDNGFALWNRPAMTQVNGVPVAADAVVVKYTWMGDMDLDGKVTVKDYNQFIHYYFNNPPTDDITWMTGDFNYDGKINVQDYNMFIQGYFHSQSLGPLSADEAIPGLMPPAPALAAVETAAPTMPSAGAAATTSPATDAAVAFGDEGGIVDLLRRSGGNQAMADKVAGSALLGTDSQADATQTNLAVRPPAGDTAADEAPVLTITSAA